MSPEISERSFEETVECGLFQHGPDARTGEANVVRAHTWVFLLSHRLRSC